MLELVPLVSIVERVMNDEAILMMVAGGNRELEPKAVDLISHFIEACYNRSLLDTDLPRRTQFYLIRAVIRELHPDLREYLEENYEVKW
jgi:hypothetical protein